MRRLGSLEFRAVWQDVPADPAPVASASRREASRRVGCRACQAVRAAVRLLREALSLSMAWALPATSHRAACPAVAWRRQDVRHPDDHQAGARPAPVLQLPEPPVRLASASQPACLGALPERQPVLQEWHLVLGSAARARVLRRAVACPAAAVLPPAAVGSAWDVRALPPAVAGSASLVQPRAAPAVPVLAMVPASRRVARAARARLPAEAEPGARRAVRAVRVRPAER
ncbi:hypothetical protein JQ562_38670, partial [Bradyrhizobium sp. AUGA SZCCT0051]|nr:hypothetical protein [Bradyrhizobium sp. AUGA SZCCT0051]